MKDLCTACPRRCGVDRQNGETGYCGVSLKPKLARAALHFWEEPCISGSCGSGTVFFSGCNLKCIYCQNRTIALADSGKEVSESRLTEILWELAQKGAHNINFVTPSHYIPLIARVIVNVRRTGFSLPFVYNSGGYDSVEYLRMLDGLIDIYIPDFKYRSSEEAQKYSSAPNYPEVAKMAIAEMYRQCPKLVYDDDGILQKGVIVRHMLLPKHVYDAKQIIKYLYTTYGNNIIYSLMSQYTPLQVFDSFPELNRRVTAKEYNKLVDFCVELGIENAYVQGGESARESFIPPFDNEGV